MSNAGGCVTPSKWILGENEIALGCMSVRNEVSQEGFIRDASKIVYPGCPRPFSRAIVVETRLEGASGRLTP
jgi:hypothetical protein